MRPAYDPISPCALRSTRVAHPVSSADDRTGCREVVTGHRRASRTKKPVPSTNFG